MMPLQTCVQGIAAMRVRVTEWLANHREVGCWSKAKQLVEHERLDQRNTHFARPVLQRGFLCFLPYKLCLLLEVDHQNEFIAYGNGQNWPILINH